MRYAEFRDRLEDALQEVGLFFHNADRRVETISGFRTVRVPRVWDSPERREAERDPRQELGRLARRFKTALDEWTKSVSELATWIRYSPPPPGVKPVEPWFDDQSEDDDDGGPESMH